jgi:hypothetical protein
VVVEKDSAQRIHVLDAETGAHLHKLETDSVGYYCFLNTDTVIFYKLTGPHSLRWRTVKSDKEHVLADRPTHSFWPVNRHAVLFGVADSAGVRYYTYDFALMKARPFAQHAHGSPATWWHKEFGLLIAADKKILRFDQAKSGWQTLFDLSSHPITTITRFVFSADSRWMAITDNPAKN